jgi:hypothetical protein
MTRHNNVIPLHRAVRLAPRPPAASPPPPAFAEILQREPFTPPSLPERVAEALGSRFWFGVFVGFYAGMLATVGFALLWSFAL